MRLTTPEIQTMIAVQFEPNTLNEGLCNLLSQQGIPIHSEYRVLKPEPSVYRIQKLIYQLLNDTRLVEKFLKDSIDETQFIHFINEICKRIPCNTVCWSRSFKGVQKYVADVMAQSWKEREQSLPPAYNASFDVVPPPGAAPAAEEAPPPYEEEVKVQAEYLSTVRKIR